MSAYALRVRDKTGYYSWIDVLWEWRLKTAHKPLGAGRKIAKLRHLHEVVCFREIRLDMLDRLVERCSPYGVGFHKDVMIRKGGSAVWYLDKESVQKRHFDAQLS